MPRRDIAIVMFMECREPHASSSFPTLICYDKPIDRMMPMGSSGRHGDIAELRGVERGGATATNSNTDVTRRSEAGFGGAAHGGP